jgi:hypothetical protein
MRGMSIAGIAPIFFIFMALSAKGNGGFKYVVLGYLGICVAAVIMGFLSRILRNVRREPA